MLNRLSRCLAVVCIGFASGCAPNDNTDLQQPYSAETAPGSEIPGNPNPDCASAPATFAQVEAFKVCVTCHATTKSIAQRSSAPIDVNFDTERDAAAHANRAVMLVMSGLMPPSASGLSVSDAAKRQLYSWAMCRM